jgi:hypothetical protein
MNNLHFNIYLFIIFAVVFGIYTTTTKASKIEINYLKSDIDSLSRKNTNLTSEVYWLNYKLNKLEAECTSH